MRDFISKSIQRKFLAVMVITLIGINLPILGAYIHMMNSSLSKEFDLRNQTVLNTNAAALAKPLWDYDYSIIPSISETILLEESILGVFIYDHENNLILRADKNHHNKAGFHDHHSDLVKDIFHEVDGRRTKVGKLSIHFDPSGIVGSIWSVIGKSLLLLTVSVGAIMVTAVVTNRHLISKPLAQLMEAIDQTQTTGQKHLAFVEADDEIGRVANKFNEMQDQLEIESDKIRDAYERLNNRHHHTPALLYSLDHKGDIRAVSDYWLACTGYVEEDVIGRPFAEFVSDATLNDYQGKKTHLALEPGEMAEATCEFRKHDGTFMDVLIRESVEQDSLLNDVRSVSVMTDITSLKQAEETLRIQAETDSLTGLLNRDGITGKINNFIKDETDNPRETALIFMDLDRFKWVNDNMGHSAGDELLRTVASRLESLTTANEFVGRFGGDEFAIVLSGPGVHDRVIELSKGIMASLGEATCINGRDFKIDVSIGISIYPDHADNALELIKAADVAMYHRKKCGRNGYTVFNSKLGQHAGKFLETEQLITQALSNDWFELHLQPIIDLKEDRIAGLEGLLRLNHPDKGLMPPSDIIVTAEKSGQILDIGDRVIDLAIGHLETFQSIPHLKECYITANFSAAQFLPGLPAKLASRFMHHGLNPDQFVLEITETVLMQESENLTEIMDAIRALGCRFALDDFGTGYSSLSYLNKFPVSFLKIDRSFVQMMAIESEEADLFAKTQTLVQGIVGMSHQLGLDVVAEGIESREDAERLIELGLDLGQGYYYSKPIPMSQLIKDAQEATEAEDKEDLKEAADMSLTG